MYFIILLNFNMRLLSKLSIILLSICFFCTVSAYYATEESNFIQADFFDTYQELNYIRPFIRIVAAGNMAMDISSNNVSQITNESYTEISGITFDAIQIAQLKQKTVNIEQSRWKLKNRPRKQNIIIDNPEIKLGVENHRISQALDGTNIYYIKGDIIIDKDTLNYSSCGSDCLSLNEGVTYVLEGGNLYIKSNFSSSTDGFVTFFLTNGGNVYISNNVTHLEGRFIYENGSIYSVENI